MWWQVAQKVFIHISWPCFLNLCVTSFEHQNFGVDYILIVLEATEIEMQRKKNTKLQVDNDETTAKPKFLWLTPIPIYHWLHYTCVPD